MMAFWGPAPVLIAGPCVVEDDRVNLAVATRLAELAQTLGLRVVFKASFDKANRSHAGAPRGPGLEQGVAALRRVREETGLPVLTDVHEPWQAERVAEVVDVLQIPAFLCRQTDLLEAAGRAGRPVNIKKGQWMAPDALRGAVSKVRRMADVPVAVTERGTFFGYGDLVIDMRNFTRLREVTGVPILFDATHGVQRPGRGPDGATGGDRVYVPPLLLGAAAAGADGFFVETHPDPAASPSDANSMWPLADLASLIERALAVWRMAREPSPVP